METDNTMIRDTQYVACKQFTLGGRQVLRGESVDVSKMADHKIGQMLNLRFIQPAAPTSP